MKLRSIRLLLSSINSARRYLFLLSLAPVIALSGCFRMTGSLSAPELVVPDRVGPAIVQANILASKSEKAGKGEVLNIGAGENYSVNEIAKRIGGEITINSGNGVLVCLTIRKF